MLPFVLVPAGKIFSQPKVWLDTVKGLSGTCIQNHFMNSSLSVLRMRSTQQTATAVKRAAIFLEVIITKQVSAAQKSNYQPRLNINFGSYRAAP